MKWMGGGTTRQCDRAVPVGEAGIALQGTLFPSRGRVWHFKSAGIHLNGLNNSYDRMCLLSAFGGDLGQLMTDSPVAVVAGRAPPLRDLVARRVNERLLARPSPQPQTAYNNHGGTKPVFPRKNGHRI
jgi:hypothetical protein